MAKNNRSYNVEEVMEEREQVPAKEPTKPSTGQDLPSKANGKRQAGGNKRGGNKRGGIKRK